LNNIWYDKIEPFQSTISGRIGLLLSICTFGLLAPLFVSFRQPQFLDKHKQINEMIVNQSEEKEKELKPRKMKRYIF
jgi:hypothetical protein